MSDVALETLRQDAARFFETLPEPPVYRRADDPARETAAKLIPPGETLLARAQSLSDDRLAGALRHHLEALKHVSEGHLTAAESSWRQAREEEKAARNAKRSWARNDETRRGGYERASGKSRYDPRPRVMLEVTLTCLGGACRKPAVHALEPVTSTHRLRCPHCQEPFIAFLGEALQMRGDSVRKERRYVFVMRGLSGEQSRVTFADASPEAFEAVRGDLLAFVYTSERALRGVTNLATNQVLRVTRGGIWSGR